MFTWLAAKWALFKVAGALGLASEAKHTITRGLTGVLGYALLIGGIILALVVIIALIRLDASLGATKLRDAYWKQRLAEAELDSANKLRQLETRITAAAEAERRKLESERNTAVARAVSLEKALAAESDDPIVFPRGIVRSFRQ